MTKEFLYSNVLFWDKALSCPNIDQLPNVVELILTRLKYLSLLGVDSLDIWKYNKNGKFSLI